MIWQIAAGVIIGGAVLWVAYLGFGLIATAKEGFDGEGYRLVGWILLIAGIVAAIWIFIESGSLSIS